MTQNWNITDDTKMRSLEWLCLNPQLRLETLEKSNDLLREFLISNKTRASINIFNILNQYSSNNININNNNKESIIQSQKNILLISPALTLIQEIKERWKNENNNNNNNKEELEEEEYEDENNKNKSILISNNRRIREENSIREHLCLFDYLHSLQLYYSWYENYQKKPHKPNEILFDREDIPYSQRLEYQHKMKQFEIINDKWNKENEENSNISLKSLYHVLLFPHGWLCDKEISTRNIIEKNNKKKDENENEKEEEEEIILRKKQMFELRKKVIPITTFLLHNLLNHCNRYDEW